MSHAQIETRIPASNYEDFDEPLQAAAAELAEELGLASYEVEARYEDDQRDVIVVTHPECHCECGRVTGERCSWSGPLAETVELEYVTPHLRGTVRAAGAARGCLERLRVHRECAELLCVSEPDWASLAE